MIVCNTTPLIILAKISHLSLLKKLFNEIYIPSEVLGEITKRPESEDTSLVNKAVEQGWIKIEEIKYDQRLKGFGFLESGELAAISLAARKKCMLIIDDAFGKMAAKLVGIDAHGTLFILLASYYKKYIRKEEAIKLLDVMMENGFYLSTKDYAQFLQALG